MLSRIDCAGRILPRREIKMNYPLKYSTRNMPHKSYKMAGQQEICMNSVVEFPEQHQKVLSFVPRCASDYLLRGEGGGKLDLSSRQ